MKGSTIFAAGMVLGVFVAAAVAAVWLAASVINIEEEQLNAKVDHSHFVLGGIQTDMTGVTLLLKAKE